MFAEKADYYVNQLSWPVFPVNRNKRPLIDGGCHAATLDLPTIRQWGERFPAANIALATGKPSGIIVIDIDGPKGEESWKRLVGVVWLGHEPICPQVITGKGRHLYFRGQQIGNRASSVLGKGIDVRGDGGSATLPPSIHQNGSTYRWNGEPHLIVPPWTPPPLSRLLRGEEAFPKYKTPYKKPFLKHEDTPPDLDKLCDMVLRAGEGERNHTLNTAAFLAAKTIAAGKASPSLVIDRLTNAALAIGLDRIETDATIKSGLRAGELAI